LSAFWLFCLPVSMTNVKLLKCWGNKSVTAATPLKRERDTLRRGEGDRGEETGDWKL